MIFSDLQKQIWKRLYRIKSNDRIGSAYCFSGPSGSGKEYAAIEFAKLLNCQKPEEVPCNKCSSCLKFKSLQHPNVKIVVPLPSNVKSNKSGGVLDGLKKEDFELLTNSMIKKGKEPFYKINIPNARRITISSIRDLRRNIYLKSQTFGRNVILIFDSHLLSDGAGESANALLKILEEPPKNTTLILVTDKRSMLLPTILSRCQIINFPRLKIEIILKILESMNIKNKDALQISSISDGNIHLALELSSRSKFYETFSELEDLIKIITKVDEGSWRKFIDSFSMMAHRRPEDFKFKIYILQLWFHLAYSNRLGISDYSKFEFLLEPLVAFNSDFPNADLAGINQILEDIIQSLIRNYYTPLTLTNFLISMQRLLKGKELISIP
ncbi:MAG: DNA polymerase III subunit [Fidelibacterota bacterium]|tara:strand:+ start:586 stop:1734 length:1149 start_codon:yes stop_codon:yes gene_type:complete